MYRTSNRLYRRLTCPLLLIFLAYCSGSTVPDGVNDATHDNEVEDIVGEPFLDESTASDCDTIIWRFTPGETDPQFSEWPGMTYWSLKSSLSGSLSTSPLSYVEIFSSLETGIPESGPNRAGIYDISYWTPHDPRPGGYCGLCIHLYEECTTECTMTYAAISGTMEIADIAFHSTGGISGFLSGVYFLEYDSAMGIIEDGASYCIDYWAFDESWDD